MGLLGLGVVAGLGIAHLRARRQPEKAAPAAPSPMGVHEAALPPDPRERTLLQLEQLLVSGPESHSVEEMLERPAFAAMVEFMEAQEYSNEDLARRVTGQRTVPAWTALVVLARRPRDEEIAERALHWLTMFHPTTRELTLRLLEAWWPDDAQLAPRLLLRMNRDWYGDGRLLVTLDAFLRRCAARGPLRFDPRPSPADAERVDDLLEELDPSLVGGLRASLLGTPAPGDAPASAAPGASARRPAAADPPIGPDPAPDAAGRWSEPGTFRAPVLYPRVTLEEARAQMMRALGTQPPNSVILTGEAGTGKTELLRAIASEMCDRDRRIFDTSPLELNAGMSFVGQLEGRLRALIERSQGDPPALWLIRDFHQLLTLGTTSSGGSGALDLLLPAIESGRILLLAETSPAGLDLLLGQRPTLARVLETVRLAPPRDEELPGIAAAWSEHRRALGRTPALGPILGEAATLARHHLGALGSPAGLLRLLERSAQIAESRTTPSAADTDALLEALAQLTGLPAALLDDRVPLDLAAVGEGFASRVMGQSEAVQALVERLALLKAGVQAPGRPYGVLLFAGPTGTGKTELAKALAAFLFGASERMVRVDMSEMQDLGAVDRLLDSSTAGAGGSLVTRVRRQPFSVVLLDEFEKAHPRVWDLFLQVFDDGRLTDSRGHTVDFRSAFLILTSNLGARLKSGERLGFVAGRDGFRPDAVTRTITEAFRPELLNRIDRIVVFRPLSRETMRDILRRQLSEVFSRRGLQRRDWAVEIEESAIEFLLERGFTPDLGARPLQRSIEQYLLAPLARRIVERRAPEGDQFLFVRADGPRLAVEFVDPDGSAPGAAASDGETPLSAGTTSDGRTLAWGAQGDPADAASLATLLAGLENRIQAEDWQGRKAALLGEIASPQFWERSDRFQVLSRAEYMDRIEAGLRSARSLLSRLEGTGSRRTHAPRDLVRRLASRLLLLEQAREEAMSGGPREAYLMLEIVPDSGGEQESSRWLAQLVSMYESWARARGMQWREFDPISDGPRLRGRRFAVSGFASHRSLAPESGLHVREDAMPGEGGVQRMLVRVRVAEQAEEPIRGGRDQESRRAAEALSLAPAASHIVRRYRSVPSPLVRDSVRGWRTGRLDRVLAGEFDVVPFEGEPAPSV